MTGKAKAALIGLGVLMATSSTKGATGGGSNRLARALAEWQRGITDTPAWYPTIDAYIRGREGAGWAWQPYDGHNFQWCGVWAGWALQLRPAIRHYHMPSVSRLLKGHGTQGHWAAGTGVGLAGGSRFVAPREARPGDIGIFGPGGEGRHIGIITALTAGGVETVEGNAWGRMPSGERAEGVIRTTRPHRGTGRTAAEYELIAVIRPLPSDYEGV